MLHAQRNEKSQWKYAYRYDLITSFRREVTKWLQRGQLLIDLNRDGTDKKKIEDGASHPSYQATPVIYISHALNHCGWEAPLSTYLIKSEFSVLIVHRVDLKSTLKQCE